MAGIDYRQSGIDYRHTIYSYQGYGHVTVTPATIACTATIPEVQGSLAYRESGVDYRQTATTYRGGNASEVNIGADPAILQMLQNALEATSVRDVNEFLETRVSSSVYEF